jgi:hypothetical protein
MLEDGVFFPLQAGLWIAFGQWILGRLLAYGRIIAVLVRLAVRRLRPRRRRSVAAIYDRRDGLEAPPAKPLAGRGRPRRLPRADGSSLPSLASFSTASTWPRNA